MRPLHIDHDGRRLAAILHEPVPPPGAPASAPASATLPAPTPAAAGAARQPTALLVCNPFGQEAVRVHRMQRVLCEQLLRGGLPSLRFDYYGAGESMGDDEQADPCGWVGDVLAADRALRARTGATRVLWFGARLGATLALLASASASASASADARPDGLVLWEPVIDGAAYVRCLSQDHERALRSSFGPFLRRVQRGDRRQWIGFGVGPAMHEQLQALRAPLPPSGVPVTVIGSPAAADETRFESSLQDWCERAAAQAGSPGPRRVALRHEFDWTAEEALNTALVPAPAVRLLRAEIEAMR
ncbi:MAG: hypothetical protein QM674_18705 [Burkholderiaceae bacterium]